jgi:hypothetical protein
MHIQRGVQQLRRFTLGLDAELLAQLNKCSRVADTDADNDA